MNYPKVATSNSLQLDWRNWFDRTLFSEYNLLRWYIFFNLFPLLTQIEYLERMLVQDKCTKRGLRKLHCQWSEELIVCTCNLINSHLFATLLSFYQHVFNPHISASIFAYGQTSSGKTYTMTGITEYSVADIYQYIKKVCVSFTSAIITFLSNVICEFLTFLLL